MSLQTLLIHTLLDAFTCVLLWLRHHLWAAFSEQSISFLIACDPLIFVESDTIVNTSKQALKGKYITPVKHREILRHHVGSLQIIKEIPYKFFLPVNIYHPKKQKSLRQTTIIQHLRLSRLADSLTPTTGSDSTQIFWMSSFQATWHKRLSHTISLLRQTQREKWSKFVHYSLVKTKSV